MRKILTLLLSLVISSLAIAQNTNVNSTRFIPSSLAQIGTVVDGKVYQSSVDNFLYVREGGSWKRLTGWWPLSGTENLTGNVQMQGVSGTHSLAILDVSSFNVATNIGTEFGVGQTVAYIFGPSGEELSITNDSFLFTGGKVRLTPSATLASMNLGSRTSDPSSLTNFDLWGRSDLNKARIRLNGVTENLATESFVSGSFWPLTGTGSFLSGVSIDISTFDLQFLSSGTSFFNIGDGGVGNPAAINLYSDLTSIFNADASSGMYADVNEAAIFGGNSGTTGADIFARKSGILDLGASDEINLNAPSSSISLSLGLVTASTLDGNNVTVSTSGISIGGTADPITLNTNNLKLLGSIATDNANATLLSIDVSGNVEYRTVASLPGLTNSGAANEMVKSNGTNIVGSGLFSAGTGSFSLTGNYAWTGSGDVTWNIANPYGIHVTDANNSAINSVLKISHLTSGSPAIGIGTALELISETTSGGFVGGKITSVSTTVSSGNETFDLVLNTGRNGSTVPVLTFYGASMGMTQNSVNGTISYSSDGISVSESTGQNFYVFNLTNGGSATNDGQDFIVSPGDGITNGEGGDVTFNVGLGAGTGRDGYIIMPNIPTADPCATAPPGTIWDNSGTLSRCP